MNIIEKRKSQFTFISAISVALSVVVGVVGIILLVTCSESGDISVLKLVFGVILTSLGLVGLGFGIFLSIMASSVKATKGSISEEIAGKGTVNMHKCSNCGSEVDEDKTICAKCEENLKP